MSGEPRNISKEFHTLDSWGRAVEETLYSYRAAIHAIPDQGLSKSMHDAGFTNSEYNATLFRIDNALRTLIAEPMLQMASGMTHFFGKGRREYVEQAGESSVRPSILGANVEYFTAGSVISIYEMGRVGIKTMYGARSPGDYSVGLSQFMGAMGAVAGTVVGGAAGASAKFTVPSITSIPIGGGTLAFATEAVTVAAPRLTAAIATVGAGNFGPSIMYRSPTDGATEVVVPRNGNPAGERRAVIFDEEKFPFNRDIKWNGQTSKAVDEIRTAAELTDDAGTIAEVNSSLDVIEEIYARVPDSEVRTVIEQQLAEVSKDAVRIAEESSSEMAMEITRGVRDKLKLISDEVNRYHPDLVKYVKISRSKPLVIPEGVELVGKVEQLAERLGVSTYLQEAMDILRSGTSGKIKHNVRTGIHEIRFNVGGGGGKRVRVYFTEKGGMHSIVNIDDSVAAGAQSAAIDKAQAISQTLGLIPLTGAILGQSSAGNLESADSNNE